MKITRIGPLALEGPLDGSSDSNVLRGVHVEQQKSIAVKLLPRSIVAQAMHSSTFKQDVKQLQQLVHPGIARCLGGAVEQGQPYLVLELVEGESLRSRLDRLGKIPWETAVEMADAICDALKLAHSKAVVHRRLTPSRILLGKEGEVKLIGFDCAWSDRDEVLGLRVPMQLAHYLAPEAFRGKKSATLPTADLFSLGVILFECLSGELPWSANTPSELVQARRAASAPRVAAHVLDCPVWLDILVARLLATKRSDRFISAEETHRAIALAQRKVASGMGAAQHAWSGRQGALQVEQDRDELRRIQRSQRPKQRDESPFYERIWFLSLCLIGLVGMGAWSLWPPSEDTLFDRAQLLMQSDHPSDWRRAEQQYLKPLRERFPETKYADQIQAFDDRLAMDQARTRMESNQRLDRAPQSEAERHYAKARRFELFGDRLKAWIQYEALVNLFAKSEERFDRAYVALARKQIYAIQNESADRQKSSELISQHLADATALAEQGDSVKARRHLLSVLSLYDGNQELQPLVDQAREQMRRLDLGEKESEREQEEIP